MKTVLVLAGLAIAIVAGCAPKANDSGGNIKVIKADPNERGAKDSAKSPP